MFMKSFSRFGVVAVAAVVVAALMAPAATAAGKVYVGDIIEKVALYKGLRAGDAVEAAAALRDAGVRLPDVSLDAELTEGTMAQIATAVGIPVSTSDPSAPVSGDQVDSFFASFGQDVMLGGGDGGAETRGHPNPGTDKGKGKKKGHFKSPQDPV